MNVGEVLDALQSLADQHGRDLPVLVGTGCCHDCECLATGLSVTKYGLLIDAADLPTYPPAPRARTRKAPK